MNDDTCIYNVKIIKEIIKIGNGLSIEAIKMGNIAAKFIQNSRDEIVGTIVNVKYIPKLWCNLFSILVSDINQGLNLGNETKALTLEKRGL